jgi:hypothetical protein
MSAAASHLTATSLKLEEQTHLWAQSPDVQRNINLLPHLGEVAVIVDSPQVVEQLQCTHQRLRSRGVHEVKVHLRRPTQIVVKHMYVTSVYDGRQAMEQIWMAVCMTCEPGRLVQGQAVPGKRAL